MSNIHGPKASKRRLLMSVTTSILLYGAEVWADALRKDKYSRKMTGVQYQSALRVSSSYRTVSKPAIMVIAGIITIALLACENKYIFERKIEVGKAATKEKARSRNTEHWKTRWTNETRERWISQLTNSIAPW
ncbi:uncharacterized protein LOC117174562 [Belonocnema kinseyi]|uniref:uncharacterized protein LOC117174562 n=1 Tax=Belonocnema kinseyi TaxID=2817044 RepID=UPI00143CECFA|nr:uncharacterized protein LOC117174562 [Belonocnema kinseyi]